MSCCSMPGIFVLSIKPLWNSGSKIGWIASWDFAQSVGALSMHASFLLSVSSLLSNVLYQINFSFVRTVCRFNRNIDSEAT